MKILYPLIMTATLGLMAITLPTQQAQAAACANGVYRAGCVGPNGAVGVRKPVAPPPVYHHGSAGNVSCASGPYRAGCAGPNGAVVRRRY